MFTLTYVLLEYETSISGWDNWNDDRNLMIDMLLFKLATRLNSQKTIESVIHNDIWHIKLYMNIGISNCNNWSYNRTKKNFLTLYQSFTRLLTSNHLKLISTQHVGRNGEMWKTCFSAPQNARKENKLKHKNQVRNSLFIDS